VATNLSEDAAKQLRAIIEASLADPRAVALLSEEPEGGAIPLNFCEIWPKALPTLRAIATATTGLGAFLPPLAGAGPVLLALVETGNAIYNSTCQPMPAE